jgi:hypothetical protein
MPSDSSIIVINDSDDDSPTTISRHRPQRMVRLSNDAYTRANNHDIGIIDLSGVDQDEAMPAGAQEEKACGEEKKEDASNKLCSHQLAGTSAEGRLLGP